MADIAAQADLKSDGSALEGASQLFGYLWEGAWQHGHATAAGDVEALHDMRVNLRRLRTAMDNFAGPKTAPVLSSHLRAELRHHSARAAKVGDRLGAVRDFDVLAEYVADYAKKKLHSDVEAVEGLARFTHYLQLRRAKAFAPMVKKIGRAQEMGELREEFARWALGLPAANGTTISLETAAKIILPRRLSEVERHAPALQPGADPEAHHDLRKSLRRLRYTLETLSVCYSAPVKPLIDTLVEMQDLLGEMQDREVLAEATAHCFGKNEPEEIALFNAHGDKRVSYLLGRVRTKWENAEKDGLWEKLSEL